MRGWPWLRLSGNNHLQIIKNYISHKYKAKDLKVKVMGGGGGGVQGKGVSRSEIFDPRVKGKSFLLS